MSGPLPPPLGAPCLSCPLCRFTLLSLTVNQRSPHAVSIQLTIPPVALHFTILMCTSWKGQEKAMAPTPVLLPGKSHGRRSLVGCSPWGRKESDTTERLHFHFSLSCIGEGNGIPLQCSCLENPRDGGAWRAAVYRVAQSWTRLKRLSGSMKRTDFPSKESFNFMAATPSAVILD